tara:strand:+ start:148 stop:885 length:738 start_codon:yes stop_codon:yes gene_type:complete
MRNIHALIPVRFGSKRIKGKSLRILGKKPLIQYCIDNIKSIDLFDKILINSDHKIYEDFAKNNNIDFYMRKKSLATSDSLIDDYIYDYFINNQLTHLVIVNPTSPFMESKMYEDAINKYFKEGYDTLLSCENIQTHCFMEDKSLNFDLNQKHPRSQDLVPIKALNFAITILNKNVFLENYERNNYGLYSGKLGFYVTTGDANIDIDYEDDFQFAENVMMAKENNLLFEKKYHKSFQNYINKDISN